MAKDNLFKKETELLSDFDKTSQPKFDNDWKTINPFIEQSYAKKELDTNFYKKEFHKSLNEKIKNDKDKPSFESVKEHFTEKWDELLFKKKTKWELEIIEEQRKKFCEKLYKQIEELKNSKKP